VDTVEVRTWACQQLVNHEVPAEMAIEVTRQNCLRQIAEQGYEPAPGADVRVERFDKEPWSETIWGADDEGNWIGDPRDYGLIARVRVIPKGILEGGS
jgi:hypothetical protein